MQNDAGPEPDQALQRAAALCSRQEQCSSHIREKLRQWGMEEKQAEEILARLKSENFLDDGRYARFFARDKFRFNHWGKLKIAFQLRQKGVGEEDIQQACGEIDPEAYFESCLKLLQQKSRKLTDMKAFIRRGKLFRFAAGKGFESDIIHRAIDRLDTFEERRES